MTEISDLRNEIGILTPKEGAEILHISEQLTMELLRTGQLKGFKAGVKSWRTTKAFVNEYIAKPAESVGENGKKSELTKNRIKYHANLRSRKVLPKSIKRMEEELKKIGDKHDEQTDDFEKMETAAKIETIVQGQTERVKKLEAMPGMLKELRGRSYPGSKDLYKESSATIIARLKGKENGAEENEPSPQQTEPEAKDTLKKVPSPEMDLFDEG